MVRLPSRGRSTIRPFSQKNENYDFCCASQGQPNGERSTNI